MRSFIKFLIKPIHPYIYPYLKQVKNFILLARDIGQLRTMQRWSCEDNNGSAIPWYTYPAIEYLRQLDFSDQSVLEFGSGNSSIFWSQRCRKLVAVEDDPTWFEKIQSQLPSSVEYHLITDKDAYTKFAHHRGEQFDVIIIDGSHREECARHSIALLKHNGFIILDNSDWEQQTSEFLRKQDLIEVDMTGFGPINDYTWTTSFYFKRSVQLKPLNHTQPVGGIGSLPPRQRRANT